MNLTFQWSGLRSTVNRYLVTGYFRDKHTDDPNVTLNTTRLKLPQTCVMGVPESQNSVRFALRPFGFLSHWGLMLTSGIGSNAKIWKCYENGN